MQLLSWWMKSSVHQLRLVVYPVIYEGFCTSKRWCRIPSINSMICHPSIPPSPPSRHLGTPPSGTCSDISCTFISWCLLAAEKGGNFSLKKTPRVEVLKTNPAKLTGKGDPIKKKTQGNKKKNNKSKWEHLFQPKNENMKKQNINTPKSVLHIMIVDHVESWRNLFWGFHLFLASRCFPGDSRGAEKKKPSTYGTSLTFGVNITPKTHRTPPGC